MVKFDLSDFERAADRVGAAKDQVAYALSQSLNDGLFRARDFAISSTWPRGVSVRDTNFLRNALRVERSDKRNLIGAVTSLGTRAGDRAHLAMHESGGIKRPAKSRIAVPSQAIKARRGARGIPRNLRPANVPNSFRRGDVIYQVTGRKKNRKLKLLYTLKTGVPIKPTVHWHTDFDMMMRREVANAFPGRFKAAMASKRR